MYIGKFEIVLEEEFFILFGRSSNRSSNLSINSKIKDYIAKTTLVVEITNVISNYFQSLYYYFREQLLIILHECLKLV